MTAAGIEVAALSQRLPQRLYQRRPTVKTGRTARARKTGDLPADASVTP
ncbi:MULTISPECIES: hypothetical protein [unclassified Variovorax]|nr:MULTISPECIES: hypothetical protein [unclassified Variovorax]